MTDQLDETYARLHRFGPEFGGDEEGNHGLTNHGPMAAEVIARRNLDVDLTRWTDRYQRRLQELPDSTTPIGSAWHDALGRAARLPDWTEYFRRELLDQPWTDVLTLWWPRLLPGIVAGSTHGLIRVSHAVRTLSRQPDPTSATVDELAHGLGFWAARFRPIAGTVAPAGHLDPARALAAVTRLPERTGVIAERLNRLEHTATWPASLQALQPATSPDEITDRLDDLIAAAVGHYARYGHAAPVLLVHTATAPNAVRHVLPHLPTELWGSSFTAAWTAAAAVMATYAPPDPIDATRTPDLTPAETLDRAAAHGDEHVLKFTDTAVEAFDRTGDPDLLAATVHAGALIESPGMA